MFFAVLNWNCYVSVWQQKTEKKKKQKKMMIGEIF